MSLTLGAPPDPTTIELYKVAGVQSWKDFCAAMEDYQTDMAKDTDAKLRPLLLDALIKPANLLSDLRIPPHCSFTNADIAKCVAGFVNGTAAPWPVLWDSLKDHFDVKKTFPDDQVCVNVCNFLQLVMQPAVDRGAKRTVSRILERCLLDKGATRPVQLAALTALAKVGYLFEEMGRRMMHHAVIDVMLWAVHNHSGEPLVAILNDWAGAVKAVIHAGNPIGWVLNPCGKTTDSYRCNTFNAPPPHTSDGDADSTLALQALTKIITVENLSVEAATHYLNVVLYLIIGTIEAGRDQIIHSVKGPKMLGALYDALVLLIMRHVADDFGEDDFETSYVTNDGGNDTNEGYGIFGVAREILDGYGRAFSQLGNGLGDMTEKLVSLLEDLPTSATIAQECGVLEVIEALVEYQADHLRKHPERMNKLVSGVCARVGHDHMYVQSTALQALSALCLGCYNNLTDEHIKQVLSVSLKALAEGNPHIQTDALYPIRCLFQAIQQHKEDTSSSSKKTKGRNIDVNVLFGAIGQSALDTPHYFFKREALRTLDQIIMSAPSNALKPLVSDLVPLFHTLLVAADSLQQSKGTEKDVKLAKDVVGVRIHALNATTHLGNRVGYANFKQYCNDIWQYLDDELQKDFKVTDHQLRSVLECISTMITVLDDDNNFHITHAMMSTVMPKIMYLANQNSGAILTPMKPGEEVPEDNDEFVYVEMPPSDDGKRCCAAFPVAKNRIRLRALEMILQVFTCQKLSNVGDDWIDRWITELAAVTVNVLQVDDGRSDQIVLQAGATLVLAVAPRIVALNEKDPNTLPVSTVDFFQVTAQRLLQAVKDADDCSAAIQTKLMLLGSISALLDFAPPGLEGIEDIRDALEDFSPEGLLEMLGDVSSDEDGVDEEEDEDALPTQRRRQE